MASVLLVVDSPAALSAPDAALLAHLVSRGHVVTLHDDNAALPTNVLTFALIVLGAGAGESQTGIKCRDVAVPVLATTLWRAANTAMTALSTSVTGAQTVVNITSPAHPLAAGFPAGVLTVSTTGTVVTFINGAADAHISQVAAANNTRATIFAIEGGTTMAGGIVAAARRVGFGLGGFNTLNAAGLSLFDAAVEWARTRFLPVPGFTVGTDGLAVTCTSSATADSGVALTKYDFGTGGGLSDATTHVYREAANYTITQRVVDADGMEATAAVQVSVAPPPAPPAVTFRLRIFEPDDATVMAEVSTDPAHPHPYLMVPENFRAQEIDLARGAARISQVDVSVTDHPTVAGDQASGYVTGLLATVGGYSAIIGRTFLLDATTSDGGEYVVMDGVCGNVALRDSFAGYSFSLRDIRERERKTRAFVSAARRDPGTGALVDAPTVWPRGRLSGYGAVNGGWELAPPVTPALATYASSTDGLGWPTFGFSLPAVDESRVPADRVFTERMRKALQPDPATGLMKRVRLLFRLPGQTMYTEAPPLSPISYIYTSHPPLVNVRRGKYRPAQGDPIDVEYVSALSIGWPLAYSPPFPLGTQVEIVLAYVGEPTADYPFRWEGPAGTLIAGLYDGLHSRDWESEAAAPAPPRIRYDPLAVAKLTTQLRLTREKPVDDLRDWAEPNIYAIQGAAPALNAAGEIAPVRYEFPDAAATLVELNNSNCAAEPGWSHGEQDAVNVVEVKYAREYRVMSAADPLQLFSAGDGIASRTVTVTGRDEESVKTLGEQRLSFAPETLRAIGGTGGQPISGDVTNEAPHQLAKERIRQALDRFVLGGQHFTVRAMRSDSAVERAQVGDWALEGTSWKPDYGTRRRGANRLAQIVGRKDLNPRWTELRLIDAGPAHQPVGQPTLGAPTTDSDGVVTVPVTAIAAGSEAAVYYAISPTLPPNGSALWTFAAPRLDAPGSRATPPLPAGATVWVRGRGEAPGRRASAYTNAAGVTLTQTPRVISAEVFPGEDLVAWTVNAFVQGLRITAVKNGAALPTLNVAAAGGQVAVPYHAFAGDMVEIMLEPWSGWVGSNVAGTAGPAFTLTWSGAEIPPAGFYNLSDVKLLQGQATPTHHALGWTAGAGVTMTRGAALMFQSGSPNSDEAKNAVANAVGPVTAPMPVPKPSRAPQFSLAMVQAGWLSPEGVEVWGQRWFMPVLPSPASAPSITSLDVFGQKVKAAGQNTASWTITRLGAPAGQEYSVTRDGSNINVDLAAQVGASGKWEIEVRAFNDPEAERDSDTLSAADRRIVRGPNAVDEDILTGLDLVAPAIGEDVLTIHVTTAAAPAYTIDAHARWWYGDDLAEEWLPLSTTPALGAPVSGTQVVTRDTSRVRSVAEADGSEMMFSYEVLVRVLDADGLAVDSDARTRSWYTHSHVPE